MHKNGSTFALGIKEQLPGELRACPSFLLAEDSPAALEKSKTIRIVGHDEGPKVLPVHRAYSPAQFLQWEILSLSEDKEASRDSSSAYQASRSRTFHMPSDRIRSSIEWCIVLCSSPGEKQLFIRETVYVTRTCHIPDIPKIVVSIHRSVTPCYGQLS